MAPPDVRFGSKADMCSAKRHVRFTPNSDRESGFLRKGHVRFTPESGHVLGYLSDGTLENIFPWHLLCVAIEHMSAYICVITDLTLGVSG